MNKAPVVYFVDSKGNVLVNLTKTAKSDEALKQHVNWDKFKEIFGDLEKGCYV